MASFKVTPNAENGHDLPPLSSAVVKAVENGTSTSVARSYAQWRDKYVRRFEGMLYVAYNDDGTNLPKDAVTVSEAIGYGMLISMMVGQREDFDEFLKFYDGHLNDRGLMSWQQVLRNGMVLTNPDPAASASNCATDADSDVAYALLLAARQWGCEEYRTRGLQVCAAIWVHCINHVTNMPMLGGWVGGPDDRFGPLKDRAYCDICRPSDFVLSHYLVFAQEDVEHASGWTSVMAASLEALAELQTDSTHGLCADFMAFDAAAGRYRAVTTQVLERPGDGTFSWNACRMPWRVAVYYWETGDKRVLPLMQALAKFFTGEKEILAGYALDGTPQVDYATLSFIAPVWCLLRVMGEADAARLEAECLRHLERGWGNYFGESILLLSRLQLECRWLNLLPQSSLWSSF